MLSKMQRLAFSAAIAGAGVLCSAVPAAAESAFLDWGAVPAQELAEERGMALAIDEAELAKAIGAQQQTVDITGDVLAAAGDNNFGSHTFAGQIMSVNIFNTGHNNAIQVQNVIAVTVLDSTVSP
ncbi:hypothetical protein AAFN88_16075 [Pelagibius sp. CAU 1746]|uniref:hypothetical protein n=1 Tax=Pelagibius sp. CAU 1746 TaxID=3140370 RepID=UPI00325BFC3E